MVALVLVVMFLLALLWVGAQSLTETLTVTVINRLRKITRARASGKKCDADASTQGTACTVHDRHPASVSESSDFTLFGSSFDSDMLFGRAGSVGGDESLFTLESMTDSDGSMSVASLTSTRSDLGSVVPSFPPSICWSDISTANATAAESEEPERSCCCFGGLFRKARLHYEEKYPRKAAVRRLRRAMKEEEQRRDARAGL